MSSDVKKNVNINPPLDTNMARSENESSSIHHVKRMIKCMSKALTANEEEVQKHPHGTKLSPADLEKDEKLLKPYVSNAQRKKFHAMENRGEISHSTVKEFDEASKGKKLPEHVAKANPDEASDAQLGEKVEHLVEQHMEDNKAAERKEGHKMAKAGMDKNAPAPATAPNPSKPPAQPKMQQPKMPKIKAPSGPKMPEMQMTEKGAKIPDKDMSPKPSEPIVNDPIMNKPQEPSSGHPARLIAYLKRNHKVAGMDPAFLSDTANIKVIKKEKK